MTAKDKTHEINHTVVVLGAGYGGIPVAHHLLKHTPTAVGLRVVLVAPNEAMLWHNATVRGILPDMLPDERLFLPIADGFARYGLERFEHVVGQAESLDPATDTVVVSTASSSTRTITYDSLVIATGSSARGGMPFKNLAAGGTTETKEELRRWQEAIRGARSVVVAGGGQTGVEVAGELGQEYGSTGQKEVTLVVDDHLPLTADIKNDVRQTVVRELEAMGVRVVPDSRVVSSSLFSTTSASSPSERGSSKTQLLQLRRRDGTTATLEADVYIPAFGTEPNAAFAPRDMLDTAGRVRVTRTLQAVGHANIFALGDVSDRESPTGTHADAQAVHLGPALQAYLEQILLLHRRGGDENNKNNNNNKEDASAAAAEQLRLPEYADDGGRVAFVLSLGRNRGTGQVGSFRPWSFLVWWFKSRHLGTDIARDFVAGERTRQVKGW